MTQFTFKKAERLKSKKLIERLFGRGRSFSKFPVRVVWLVLDKEDPADVPMQLAVSVPKRAFPRAVDRNRVRRQMREAYRLHKHHLYTALKNGGQKYALMLIYQAREKRTYNEIAAAVEKILTRLAGQVNKSE